MGRAMSAELLAELSTGLTILSNTAGSFVLTGGYTTPFHKLPVSERESILQSWGTSSLAPRRTLVRAFACKSVRRTISNELIRQHLDYSPFTFLTRL